MKDISLTEMLKAGVHFGHKASKRHPKMDPFIFTNKNDLCIIDLEKTKEQLEKARQVIFDLSSQGKIVLFVGTKKQAKELVKKYAQECGMPYATERWTGGLLTNYAHVSRLMKELRRLKRDQERGDLGKYTKKEQLDFQKKIEKLDKIVGGMEQMDRIPDALFLVDVKEDKTAVKEAKKKGVATIAIVDTNDNPEMVTYAIPANNDALKSLDYVSKIICEAAVEGSAALAPQEKEKQEDKKLTNNKEK